jgi:hypothetical protein
VLFIDRINQYPFAGGHIGQQVAEGAGFGVKQLAEEQLPTPGGGTQGKQRGRGKGHGPWALAAMTIGA